MIATDRDALVCDLAETYGVYDMRALPASVLATLAVGLRDDSRIKLKLAGMKVPRDTILMAAAVDRLSALLWVVTGGTKSGITYPKSLLAAMMGVPSSKQSDSPVLVFDTPADFQAAWNKATGVSYE